MNLRKWLSAAATPGIILGFAGCLAVLIAWSDRKAQPVRFDVSTPSLLSARAHSNAKPSANFPSIQTSESEEQTPVPLKAEFLRPEASAVTTSRQKAHGLPTSLTIYEPIVASLGLSAAQLHHLEALVTERAECARDIEQLSRDYRLSSEASAIIHSSIESGHIRKMEELLGAEKSATLRNMFRLTPQLAEITDSVGRLLSAQGAPMRGDQLLELAQIYSDVYVPKSGAPHIDRKAGFDEGSGLAETERQVLNRASEFLDEEQFQLLRDALARLARSRG